MRIALTAGLLLAAISAGPPAAAQTGGARASDPAAEALRKAVFDFCAPLAEDRTLTSPERIVDAGIIMLPGDMPAPKAIFPESATVRGFFALRPTSPTAAYVDGLIDQNGTRCAIRVINAPRAERPLVQQLVRRGSGWRRLPAERKGGVVSDAFLRDLPSKPYDLLINVTHQNGAAGPDGMTAFVSVGRSTKGGK